MRTVRGDSRQDILNYCFEDDMETPAAANNATIVASDSGAGTYSQKSGNTVGNVIYTGALTLNPSDGTVADNDEIYYNRSAICAIGSALDIEQAFVIQAIISYTDVSNLSAYVFGIQSDAVAANLIADGGASLGSSLTGIWIYKRKSGTKWRVKVKFGSVDYDVETDVSTVGGGLNQVLEIHIRRINTNSYKIDFHAGEVKAGILPRPMRDPLQILPIPIGVDITTPSSTEFNLVVGTKIGTSAATTERVVIDRIALEMVRS